MKFLFLLVAVCTLSRASTVNERIIGGSPAEITEAPYQVALLLDVQGTFSIFCGGSILRRSVIVSAAQCTNGTTSSQWRIRAGSSTHNSGGQVVSVDRIVQHSEFNPLLTGDIAILFLQSQLIIEAGVTVVNLPTQGQTVMDGTQAFVTGWGYLSEAGSLSQQLHSVIVPVINQEQCASAYASINPVTTKMICAGKPGIGGQDACNGDTGGPMLVNGVLHGITSWGLGCGRPNYWTVYTRVSSYRNWIDSTINSYAVYE